MPWSWHCLTPLGELTVPASQRNFATRDNLPTYPEKIAALKAEGAKLVLVYGIGRMCHIAFWEPTFAADYETAEEWAKAPYRIGAKIHPLTVEQNALTSFKSRTTLVPCRANTVGPACSCRQTMPSAVLTACWAEVCSGRALACGRHCATALPPGLLLPTSPLWQADCSS